MTEEQILFVIRSASVVSPNTSGSIKAKFSTLPFGVKDVPSSFQCIINLSGLIGEVGFVYHGSIIHRVLGG